MTIDELKSYKALKAEYVELSTTLNAHSVSDSVQGSMQDYPYVLCSRRIDGTEMGSVEILRRMSDIKHKIVKIEKFIHKIDDFQTRKMFELKVIKGYSWVQVAHKVNSTADGCRMKVKRFLQNF